MHNIYVSHLFIYPIKSCGGVEVKSAVIAPTGFMHDRTLMLTNLSGHFLSQRSLPQMALIRPEIIDENRLQLNAPGMETLTLSINRTGDSKQVIVWGDWCFGVDQGDVAADWFSDFLKTDARLVAMLDGSRRPVDPDYAITDNDITSFTDGYPFLMLSEASLDALNERLDEPVGIDRFRPNIVISGIEAHGEDEMGVWEIGDVRFSAVKLCARCVIPTIDQTSAIKGVEPNRTLAQYRQFNQKLYFGNNLIHHRVGAISVGDSVSLLK